MTSKDVVRRAHPDAFCHEDPNNKGVFYVNSGSPKYQKVAQGTDFPSAWEAAAAALKLNTSPPKRLAVYTVGGCVRDFILGRQPKDIDRVIVGATHEDMIAANFKQVGKDFPVYLNDKGEEFALARTERKVAAGYQGFQFNTRNVTLEQDLYRRDLTVNSIAMDDKGNIIDPWGGVADLKAGVLRHTSRAFREDPVRILRTCRFAARFNFTIDPNTMRYMTRMVDEGEVDALVPDRVWKETERALMEPHVGRYFSELQNCKAFSKIFPDLDYSDVDDVVKKFEEGIDLPVRIAVLLLCSTSSSTSDVGEKLRAPKLASDLAVAANIAIQANLANPQHMLVACKATRAYQKDQFFFEAVCKIGHIMSTKTWEQTFRNIAAKARTITDQQVMADGFIGRDISKEVDKRRIQILTTTERSYA